MKRLAFLLLPLGIAFALLVGLFLDLILGLWFLAAIGLGFAVQTVILFLTRQGPKPLRWAPLGLLAVPLLMALNVRHRGFFWELEVILWLLLALFYLLGWAAAWGLDKPPAP